MTAHCLQPDGQGLGGRSAALSYLAVHPPLFVAYPYRPVRGSGDSTPNVAMLQLDCCFGQSYLRDKTNSDGQRG